MWSNGVVIVSLERRDYESSIQREARDMGCAGTSVAECSVQVNRIALAGKKQPKSCIFTILKVLLYMYKA